MALRFTVLASGSAGNATLVEAGGFGLLIDAGLGPRQLAERLAAAGASWHDIHALLLTHTHSDHWNDRTLAHLRRRSLPVYCHAGHLPGLEAYSRVFPCLQADKLVRLYEAHEDLALAPGLRCRPLPLRHDGGPTFGFRLESGPDIFGQSAALAYLADLGCWNAELAGWLKDVDLLAVEFNHDVGMQYASGRDPRLITRVLGDEGHLSNAQAAELVREVLRLSAPGRLRHVVQLHLSRECNRPGLAAAVAHEVRDEQELPFEVHTASQHSAAPTLHVGTGPNGRRLAPRRPRARPRTAAAVEPWLPGFENG
jgi:phosphoribosyl 1,2-cyclic phosphodiesterase